MLKAQSPAAVPKLSARLLDSLLQDYAFRAFEQRPRTGIVYNANVPAAASNLTGIKISAVRLRSGSLRRRGIYNYKEFDIPIGVVEQPFVERLVLVYQNLGNCSSSYYPLPGYTYLAPVVGILAYDASNLSATNLPELDVRASKKPILIRFPNVKWEPRNGVSPMCVHFDLYGSVEFDNVLSGNVCSTTKQGHFSIAVEFTAPSPPAAAAAAKTPPPRGGGVKVTYKEFIVVGSAVGGVVLVTLLAIIVIWVRNCRRRVRIQKMEGASQGSVPLSMTSIGSMKVPVANMTRTRPTLENEYVL